MIVNVPEYAVKSRTIDGLPCIVIEKTTANASGRASESYTLSVYADNELGNELADLDIERINKNKVRI